MREKVLRSMGGRVITPIAQRLLRLSGFGCFVLICGCVGTTRQTGSWLSDRDLQDCKAAALHAFASGHTVREQDKSRPVILLVGDWRTPDITVYLPVKEMLPSPPGLTYVYYRFEGTNRFNGRSELVEFAVHGNQKFALVESGITSWGTRPISLRRY